MQEVTIHSKRDIIDFVNSNDNPSRGNIMVFIALGGIFIDAYDFTSLGIGVDSLRSQLSLTPFQLGSVTAIMAFGGFLGAFGGGYVTDRLGRFKTFIIDLICLVIAALGSAFAPNLATLLFFRFLLGIGVGMDFPVALSFIAEFTNSRTKGKFVNLWQAMWYIAAACTGLVALPIFFLIGESDNLWRWAVGFGAVPALIILILRLKYIDESPMWAAHNRGLQEAAEILEKNYDVRTTVSPQEETTTASSKPSLGAIFQKGFRARTVLVSIITSTQSMEYFAIGFYLPSITALIFGKGALFAILGAIVFNVFGIVGGLTQSFITHRLGIWKLALIGYCIAAASLFLVGLTRDSIPAYLAALLVGAFIFGHSFGPGSQGMTMATLSYPTQFRGVGSGWGQSMVRVGSILGFYVFPLILAAVGLTKTLLFLTAVPLIGLVALLLIRWDPIGQDVEDKADPVAEGGVGSSPQSAGEPE